MLQELLNVIIVKYDIVTLCMVDSNVKSTADMQRSRTVSVCKRLVYISSSFVYFTLVSVVGLPL